MSIDTKLIKRILETPFWIPEVETRTLYTRVEDDCDGGHDKIMAVEFTDDGDAWVQTHSRQSLRFRTRGGGGNSLRVRMALVILAYAIKLDNEERPIA